jgi:hypothetical protein
VTAYRVIVRGAPRTKKTSNQFVIAGNRRLMMPSKAWRQWCKAAPIYLQSAEALLPHTGQHLPEQAYNCRALFYRDADRGDAVGFYQGLADLLEKRGVLVNDRNITQWDGSRLLIDRLNPRVEVMLEAV